MTTRSTIIKLNTAMRFKFCAVEVINVLTLPTEITIDPEGQIPQGSLQYGSRVFAVRPQKRNPRPRTISASRCVEFDLIDPAMMSPIIDLLKKNHQFFQSPLMFDASLNGLAVHDFLHDPKPNEPPVVRRCVIVKKGEKTYYTTVTVEEFNCAVKYAQANGKTLVDLTRDGIDRAVAADRFDRATRSHDVLSPS